jgi:hypothetical protein
MAERSYLACIIIFVKKMFCPSVIPGLPLHLDGIELEVRLPQLGVYADLLADTEFQKIGEENWRKERKMPQAHMPGAFMERAGSSPSLAHHDGRAGEG